LRATQGAVLFVSSSGTATFASSKFSSNTPHRSSSYNNYGYCFKQTGFHQGTITGTCG
jgi:hypothetical protein